MKGPLNWTLATVAAATEGIVDGDPAMPVCAVSTDSRSVAPGTVFVALRGPNHDGHDHAVDAVSSDDATIYAAPMSHGAGLYNNRRTVTLNNVIIQNNNVIGEENSSVGGGLFNIGTMEMYDCTITNNDAQRGGGNFQEKREAHHEIRRGRGGDGF